jgi:hypothetical protein
MDFVDATLLRLADEQSRAAVFDEIALEQLLAAAHDIAGLDAGAPMSAIFDELRFSFPDERRVALRGSWMTIGHTDRTELAFDATNLASGLPRIDAVWTGAITATSGGGNAVVDRVDGSFDTVNQDREIASLKVHYASAADTPPATRRFDISAALLVRPATISISGLLDETRRVRASFDQLDFRPSTNARTRTPIVIWVVPGALFDDEAWPGADGAPADQRRTRRRMWAGTWLARERIGLVVPSST